MDMSLMKLWERMEDSDSQLALKLYGALWKEMQQTLIVQRSLSDSQQGNGPVVTKNWILPTTRFNLGTHIPLVAQMIKNLPIMQETWVWSLGWEDPLKKGMATHSSIFALRIILWTEEPGRLQSMGWQRDRHSLVTNTLLSGWKLGANWHLDFSFVYPELRAQSLCLTFNHRNHNK